MRHARLRPFAILPLLLPVLVVAPVATATNDTNRFATFNASLNRSSAGQALADLSAPGNAQAAAVAEIIQRVRPDVLLINEFDYYAPTAEHPDGPFRGVRLRWCRAAGRGRVLRPRAPHAAGHAGHASVFGLRRLRLRQM